MKNRKYTSLIIGLLAATSGISFATISISTQFGQAFDINSNPVPDGTLWALIVNADGNSVLPGGMLTDGSGLSAAFVTDSALVLSTFQGQSISVGSNFGGDIVFGMGAFNGFADLGVAGSTTNGFEGLVLGENGLATGRAFGFYFFPGVEYTGDGTYNIGGQVGGISTILDDEGAGTVGMVIPADGASVFVGANTDAGGDLAGSMTDGAFTAVPIPEPSAALLGALGALGLLRRRRI